LADWLPKTVPRDQPTPLWAAVDQAITEFNATGIDGRRVIMVLSDSKDSGPQKMGSRSCRRSRSSTARTAKTSWCTASACAARCR
jgi:hypothetical protein